MQTFEVLIWASTAGGILAIAIITLAVMLMHRSRAALQVFVFLASSGVSVLLLSGLAQFFWPQAPAREMLALKVGLLPLSSAISLNLLGRWLGVSGRDRLVHLAVKGGALSMAAVALGLVVAAFTTDLGATRQQLLQIAAVASFLSFVLGALASVRTAMLGDRLSWMMVLACAVLSAGASSLYVHALYPGYLGLGWQAGSAMMMMAYFIAVGWLAFQRDAQYRRIQRHLRASGGRDPLTKLPQGAALLAHIEQAARRSARLRRECAVVAISVTNMFALNEEVGYDVDHEVAVALSARIRHLAGIHNSVGLYHPSCFVVVVAAVQTPALLRTLGLRLASGLRKPLALGRLGDDALSFKADVGIGIARLDGDLHGDLGDASFALEEAEQLALQARGFASRAAIRGQEDDQATPVETYTFGPRARRRERAFASSSITRY